MLSEMREYKICTCGLLSSLTLFHGPTAAPNSLETSVFSWLQITIVQIVHREPQLHRDPLVWILGDQREPDTW